jgi:hypothetical protein
MSLFNYELHPMDMFIRTPLEKMISRQEKISLHIITILFFNLKQKIKKI